MKKIQCPIDIVKDTCKGLSDKMKKENITDIIAIGRGGLVPARYISTYLGVRQIQNIGINIYTEDQKNTEVHIYQQLTGNFDEKSSVLIVDDIVDSGDSMSIAFEYVKDMGAGRIVTCSIHTKADSPVVPTYTGFVVDDPNIWVIYDWE